VETVTLRLPRKLVVELDKLTTRMKKLPTHDPETLSRADVIRIALRRGVQQLQKDVTKAEK
jgi:Arc/MetJ-type ribon-helix-helix transcriptional regulator